MSKTWALFFLSTSFSGRFLESLPTTHSNNGMAIKAKITAVKVSHPVDPIEIAAETGIVYAAKYLRSFILTNIKKVALVLL